MGAKIQRTEKPSATGGHRASRTIVALTLKDCDVTASAVGIISNPTISAKKGCTRPSARLRRPVRDAFMAVQD
jgi:hypothetical protein